VPPGAGCGAIDPTVGHPQEVETFCRGPTEFLRLVEKAPEMEETVVKVRVSQDGVT